VKLRALFFVGACFLATRAMAVDLDAVARRMDTDAAAGKPLIAHVIVALCDNENQGIVPVPAHLGRGDDPRSNLYWGAMFGVKTFFKRSGAWQAHAVERPKDPRVLERVLFSRTLSRGGRQVTVYLLADAWDGRHMKGAIQRFLEMSRGQHEEVIRIGDGLSAGGGAHLVAFVGHNGLMDFPVPELARSPVGASAGPRASTVLACYSDHYFAPLLRVGSAPLVTTSGLMAPEAYTLDAMVTSWFGGANPEVVESAAARAYARYQKISERAALRLFIVPAAPGP
jgi:hypothetical protein